MPMRWYLVMKKILAVIYNKDIENDMNSSKNIALQQIFGKNMIDYSIKAAATFTEDIVIFTDDEDVINSYESRNELISSVDEIKTRIKKFDIVVFIYPNIPMIKGYHIQHIIKMMEQNNLDMLYAKDAVYCIKSKIAANYINNSLFDDFTNNITKNMIADIDVMRIVDRKQLSQCYKIIQKQINNQHMENGVTLIDPENTYIDYDVTIGMDSVIYPGVILSGNTSVGENVTLYPGCRIKNTIIGDNCVLQAVVSNDAQIGNDITIGPFVNIRPNTKIMNGCKIGDFVEIKNSTIDEGTKVPHLTYVGDADVGKKVNIGCGTVFVNYDGYRKHRTTVGDNVFIGCNTNLVAPVCVENDTYTAAGSTITDDVKQGSIAIARARQVNKEGWVEKYRKKNEK